MATKKQIAANQKNAKRSTGPTTTEGKAKSRRNALRDGLTGQVITLSDEDRPFFEQQIAEMLAALDPQNAFERKLAHSIAWDTWRLDHLRAVETNVYTLGREEPEDDDYDPEPIDIALADTRTYRAEPRLELMSLYESRMTRNLHRNVTLLRELQAERKRNYERDKKEEIQVARLCEFNDMPIKASVTPSKNGFIFSNEEIAAGAGDTILAKLLDKRPLSEAERREIESVPPEARAIHRLNHPEEYGLRLVS